jgi:hypothetical protein
LVSEHLEHIGVKADFYTLFGSAMEFGIGSKFQFDGLDAETFHLGMINF